MPYDPSAGKMACPEDISCPTAAQRGSIARGTQLVTLQTRVITLHSTTPFHHLTCNDVDGGFGPWDIR
jgi:hypothetical protein